MALARTPAIKYLYNASRTVGESDRENTDNEQANNTPGTQLYQDNYSEHWNLYTDKPNGIGLERGRENIRQGNSQPIKPEAEIDRAWKEQLPSAHGRLKKRIELIEDKTERVEKSVEKCESDWDGVVNRVEGAESKMAERGSRLDEVRRTRVNQSARIHALEDELRNVKIQNDAIKQQLIQRGDIDESELRNSYGRNGDGRDRYSNGHSTGQGQGYGVDQRGIGQYGLNQGAQGFAKNEQHRTQHVGKSSYMGFNQIYSPAFATSYRREQATIDNARALKGETTQYDEDYNYIQAMQRRQEEEWNRKRRLEEEEMFLKQKPLTYGYTAPYQSLHPPPDVNKFFHDSKYMERRQTYSPPLVSYQKQPAGGLYVLRFNTEGFSEVTPALRAQQSVIRSSNGYVLGLARSNNIIVLEGDADWTFTTRQKPRYDIECNHRCVDEGIIMLWFPSYMKAVEYANSTVKNKFREKHFPTPHSSESRYIELNSPPFIGELDTFLFIEFLNVGNKEYLRDCLDKFKDETKDRILEFNRNSIPFVASYFMPNQIEMLRGARGQMFKVNSMVFVSRFSSLQDVAELWRAGIIQQARQNWGLNGPANIYAIALKDNED